MKKKIFLIGGAVLLCCVLVLCAVWAAVRPGEPADQPAAAADTPAEQETSQPTESDVQQEPELTLRDQEWATDIHYFQQKIAEKHIDPFFRLPQEEFDRQIEELIGQVPELDDIEIILSLQKIAAQLGDTHTRVSVFSYLTDYPYNFYVNSDGSLYLYQCSYVDDDMKMSVIDYYQIVQINGVDIQYILDQLEMLSSRASNQYISGTEFIFGLISRETLQFIGIPCYQQADTFTLLDGQGRTFNIDLVPGEEEMSLNALVDEDHRREGELVPTPSGMLPINLDWVYWYEYLDEEKTMHIIYNMCRDKPEQSFAEMIQEAFAVMEQNGAQKLVIDLRNNSGGNSSIADALYAALLEHPEIAANTYALIGTRSASSAVMCMIYLSENFDIPLVGTPSGDVPSGFGNTETFTLPNSGVECNYGTKYFWMSSDIPSLLPSGYPPEWYNTVMPDVYISTDIQDLAEGRDPALEWVLAQ